MELQADREVVLAAVAQTNYTLRHTSAELWQSTVAIVAKQLTWSEC